MGNSWCFPWVGEWVARGWRGRRGTLGYRGGGGSKRALAANTSLVVVISGRYARPRSRSVLEDTDAGRPSRETRRSRRSNEVEISRGRLRLGPGGPRPSRDDARSRADLVERALLASTRPARLADRERLERH